MSNLPPPPHHSSTVPITTSTTSTTTAAEPVTPDQRVSNEVGNKVKGFFGAIHSAGEVVRGAINSTTDGLGDSISNRNSNEVVDRNAQNSAEHTIQNGATGFENNLNKLVDGDNTRAGTTTTTSTTQAYPSTTNTGI